VIGDPLDALAAKMFRRASKEATGNEWDWADAGPDIQKTWLAYAEMGEEAGWAAYTKQLEAWVA
jgi:hypothetical protein